MKIAVDAMGGDNAPREVVEGAYLALKEFNIETILVGMPDKIQSEINRLGITDFDFDIREAKQVVQMGESPTRSARTKQDSSIRVALELVKKSEASRSLFDLIEQWLERTPFLVFDDFNLVLFPCPPRVQNRPTQGWGFHLGGPQEYCQMCFPCA